MLCFVPAAWHSSEAALWEAVIGALASNELRHDMTSDVESAVKNIVS